MSEKKPFIDIESEFDPGLIYVVRKYSIEETKWQMEHGGQELLDKYPDLEHDNKDVIASWKKLEAGINPLAETAAQINEQVLPKLGSLVLGQSGNTSETITRSQAYLDFAAILTDMLEKYAASKDSVVLHHTLIAKAALNLVDESTALKKLEEKEFRDKIYKSVYPTLEAAIKSQTAAWEKVGLANHAYITYVLFLRTNPVLSKDVDMSEYEKESIGRRRSFLEEQRKLAEELTRKIYEDE